MSFLLPCPQCGPRDVYEFRWGGEYSSRPAPGSPHSVWPAYLYFRTNAAGLQEEWWYHRMGCRRWFLAVRDARINAVQRTYWPEQRAGGADASGPEETRA